MDKNYFELRLKINPEMEDLIAEIFFDNFDCEGVVLAEETYKDLEMISTTEGTLKIFLKDDDSTTFEDMKYDIENVLDLYREEFQSRGLTDDELGSWDFELEEKKTEDWSQKWKEKWDVTHVTDKIAVVPDWIDYKPKENEVIIKLEPGCAFGTGTHQTTQLCMKALEKYMNKGDKVADIGMGSGILSILAKKLGATSVYGCDTDDTVIEVAKENAKKNGIKVLDLSDFNPPLEGGSKFLISGWGTKHKYPSKNIQLAKNLRNNSTKPEQILWQYLRNSQLEGVKFRRQQPIGSYIVDFMAAQEKIIIELDGGQHNENLNIQMDKIRDEYLATQGYTVIRFWNNDIYNNIEGVLLNIKNIINNPTRKSKIFTLPQGEGNIPNVPDIPIDGVYFELGSADKINDKFDFVCANILHFVLAEIMGDLKNLMKTGAMMSLSGILDEKKQMVIDAYEKENLELVEEIHQDQWTSFVVKRID